MIGRVARLYFSLPRTRRAFDMPTTCITSAVRARVRAPDARVECNARYTRYYTIMTFLPKVILVVLYNISKLRGKEGKES